MKRPLTRGEKLLFATPLLLILVAAGVQRWSKSQPPTIELPSAYNVKSLSFSPDGKRLLAIFSNPPSEDVEAGRVYDVATRSTICDLQIPPHNPASKMLVLQYAAPSWSSDGKRILALYDETVGTKPAPPSSDYYRNHVSKFAVWNAKSGTLTGNHLYAPLNEETHAEALRFSSNGKQLIGEGGGSAPAALFDAATGKRLRRLEGTFACRFMAKFNEKLGLLALINENGTRLQVFDTKAKRVVCEMAIDSPTNFQWHHDLLSVTTTDPDDERRKIVLWDGLNRKELPSPSRRFQQFYKELSFSPRQNIVTFYNYREVTNGNGKRIHEGEILAWDYHQHRVLWRYPSSEDLCELKWSPDGQRLAALRLLYNDSCNLLIFDRNGQLQSERRVFGGWFNWSPDNRHIAINFQKPSQPVRIQILDVGE